MRHRFGKSLFVLGSFGSVAVVALVVLLMAFTGIPQGVRPHVFWLLWSRQYKPAVLSSSPDSGFRHLEWDGDGWGGLPVGDWTGYLVYDPSDSLPQKRMDTPAARVNGIPCDVVSVRRLEKGWYSVVTDMNEFWDREHPDC